MDKLDNYIYYSICEKSYELFEDSNFMSYRMFCNSMKNSIILKDIGKSESNIIGEISRNLQLIYHLDYEESMEYIGEYFLNDKFVIFEEPVRLVKDFFKNSFN
jgi:hypothetical protein